MESGTNICSSATRNGGRPCIRSLGHWAQHQHYIKMNRPTTGTWIKGWRRRSEDTPPTGRGIFAFKTILIVEVLALVHDDIEYISLLLLPLLYRQRFWRQYPSSQNSPPHNCFLTSGCSLNITLALKLLRMPTTLEILYRGGNDKNMCTWSAATSSVSITNLMVSAISSKSSLTRSWMSPRSIHFRYFGAHTR